MNNQTQIRALIREDIVAISEAFNKIGWNKPPSLFEKYLKEQEAGERLVWVAYALCHPRENGDPVDSRLRGNDNYESRNDNYESRNDNLERGNDNKKAIAGYVTLNGVAYALCHPRENGDPVDSRLRRNDNWESRNDNLERGNDNKKAIAGYVTLKLAITISVI